MQQGTVMKWRSGARANFFERRSLLDDRTWSKGDCCDSSFQASKPAEVCRSLQDSHFCLCWFLFWKLVAVAPARGEVSGNTMQYWKPSLPQEPSRPYLQPCFSCDTPLLASTTSAYGRRSLDQQLQAPGPKQTSHCWTWQAKPPAKDVRHMFGAQLATCYLYCSKSFDETKFSHEGPAAQTVQIGPRWVVELGFVRNEGFLNLVKLKTRLLGTKTMLLVEACKIQSGFTEMFFQALGQASRRN